MSNCHQTLKKISYNVKIAATMRGVGGLEALNRQVGRGITGPEHPTCFVNALQGISARYIIPDYIYEMYESAIFEQFWKGENSRRTRQIIRAVLEEVGGSSLRNISTRLARNPGECEKYLENARQGGRRIIVYLKNSHIVGLLPVGNDQWEMVSNWIPTPNNDGLTSRQVFDYLEIPDRKEKNRHNILSLKPEPRLSDEKTRRY